MATVGVGPAGARVPGLRFSIDRGGTFTDVYAEVPVRLGGGHRVLKLLSEDTANYRDAPTEGIRRVLEAVTGKCPTRARTHA
jgi:5-oxoprolinase (ATP-hydrolysing)